MSPETAQSLQLIFTAVIVPLQAWQLTQLVSIGRSLSAHEAQANARLDAHEEDIRELFGRIQGGTGKGGHRE